MTTSTDSPPQIASRLEDLIPDSVAIVRAAEQLPDRVAVIRE